MGLNQIDDGEISTAFGVCVSQLLLAPNFRHCEIVSYTLSPPPLGPAPFRAGTVMDMLLQLFFKTRVTGACCTTWRDRSKE